MKQHGYDFKRGKEFERRLHIWADNDGASWSFEKHTSSRPTQISAHTTHPPTRTHTTNTTDFIMTQNAANHTYRLGHNAFSHLSPEEFRGMMGLEGRGAGHPMTRTGTPQRLPTATTAFMDEEDLAGLDEMQVSVWAQQEGLADEIDWVVRVCVLLLDLLVM